MTLKSNSATPAYGAKAEPDTAIYKSRVAEVTMQTVDAMPAPYRSLVQDFGYIDVYRAWRKGFPPHMIKAAADRTGGFFVLDGVLRR
jgi:hypothetical protein